MDSPKYLLLRALLAYNPVRLYPGQRTGAEMIELIQGAGCALGAWFAMFFADTDEEGVEFVV